MMTMTWKCKRASVVRSSLHLLVGVKTMSNELQ